MSVPIVMKPETDLLGEAGDRWLRSLTVLLSNGSDEIRIDGCRFEEFMTALRIRHLAFHPRTRDLIPGSMPAAKFRDLALKNWFSIDSYGLVLEGRLVEAMPPTGDISWRLK